MHLAHISKAFGEGDYATPMFVHGGIPPGVTTKNLLKEKIQFGYQTIDGRARVTIATDDPIAQSTTSCVSRLPTMERATHRKSKLQSEMAGNLYAVR